MIDANGADAYFAGRTMGRAWREYSAEQRACAVEQAKRDLSRALGRAMREDEPQYRYGDQTRDAFAVYEQALYTLLRDARPGSTGADIPSLEPDGRQDHPYTLGTGRGKWSEEALAWLGVSSRVETVMG